MSDHPETPPAAPSPPEVVTLTESAWSVVADLEDLARQLPGDPAATAMIARRLAEETAEIAAMITALPSRPPSMAGHSYAAVEAVSTALTAEHDFGGWLAAVLAAVAARAGSTAALTAGRPGSWESALVDQLVQGTVGPAENLPHYGPGSGSSL